MQRAVEGEENEGENRRMGEGGNKKSSEHRAQSTGHRAQGAGEEAQGTGHRAQRKKLRAQSTGTGLAGLAGRASLAGLLQ